MRRSRMRIAMWCLAISAAVAAVMTIPFVGRAAPGGARITATPIEPTAADLAAAIKVKWWCYHLKFEKRVKGISVVPCELRRQQDGTWGREDLTDVIFDGTQQFQEIDIAFFIPDTPGRKKFALKVGSSFQWGTFKKSPDLENVWTQRQVVRMIEGCLGLAYYPEKNPGVMTGREENMLRLFGLHIETSE
jgi:hypothetical protein